MQNTEYYLNHLLGVLVTKPNFNTLLECYEGLKSDLRDNEQLDLQIDSLDAAFKQAVEHWKFAN
ncbi:MAG: hypothetical protein LPK26_18450 [Bacillaceae bacterium]|nr:hypothetical protein [Bacillaceae bacterium]